MGKPSHDAQEFDGAGTDYLPHAFADLFPTMADDELAALKADLTVHGLRQPIVLFEGAILDGRNRYRACREAGVTVRFEQFFGVEDDALAFVLSTNLHRRHLSAGQKAALALGIEALEAERAKERQRSQAKSWIDNDIAEIYKAESGQVEAILPQAPERQDQARDIAAKRVGCAARYVQDAKAVKDQAPDLFEKVRSGATTLPKAKKEIKRREREKRKEEAAASGAQLPRQEAHFILHRAACADLMQVIDPQSVDWIITDPPYPQKFLPVYDDLACLAAHALKPGGVLLAMVGQSYLPDILAKLSQDLTYHWMLAYLTPGGQAVQVHQRKVNAAWKPILAFSNGPYSGRWFGDVTSSKVNDNDKAHHYWGQSTSGMADLMARFVSHGDVVLDPFLGGGTTGVVALKLGAHFIGADIDETTLNLSTHRLHDLAERADD